MPTCPKGHTSTATDYCDECGAPLGAAATPPPAATSPSVAAAPSAASAPAGTGEPCPECGTPRDGRFCEVCGHDFLASTPAGSSAAVGGNPSAAGASTPGDAGPPAPPVPGRSAPAAAASPAPAAAASPAPAAAASPAPAASASPSSPAVAPPSSPPGSWRVVASADRAYYERMQAAGGPDAEPVAFPAFCPERRFPLEGTQVLIGRRSRSRGIEPAIDLTGPPEDAGVSHAHALLVADPDGTWSVVDLDSANGTYLNEATDPLPANQPTPLAPGDRIHVGAWTTLTVVAV